MFCCNKVWDRTILKIENAIRTQISYRLIKTQCHQLIVEAFIHQEISVEEIMQIILL